MRNPYRFSFDRATGDLIVADVGQNNIEEVNMVCSGGNYGWNLKEGTFKFDPMTGQGSADLSGLPGTLIDPVLQCDHDEGLAIIGGFVYRGSALPALVGTYIFGDYTRDFGPSGRLMVGDLTTGLREKLRIGLDDRGLGIVAGTCWGSSRAAAAERRRGRPGLHGTRMQARLKGP